MNAVFLTVNIDAALDLDQETARLTVIQEKLGKLDVENSLLVRSSQRTDSPQPTLDGLC